MGNMAAAADMCNPITTYSGGWKVKMQLACAQLIDADILMIDDPTGHLDVKNIKWVKQWLTDFEGSIIATSANTIFLNEMCTHIVDFNDRKLRQFKGEKGNVLNEFVAMYPEKASYFELSDKNEQRVKVVICACCWQNPHIVILDEPTNYLDRDGLGALVRGLEAFQGGVVIISHNEEFTDSVCSQKWIMEKSDVTGAGRLREEGVLKFEGELEEQQGPDEVFDESGNKIEVNKKKAMDPKDDKKKNLLSEEEVWEFGDKLEELKSALEGQ